MAGINIGLAQQIAEEEKNRPRSMEEVVGQQTGTITPQAPGFLEAAGLNVIGPGPVSPQMTPATPVAPAQVFPDSLQDGFVPVPQATPAVVGALPAPGAPGGLTKTREKTQTVTTKGVKLDPTIVKAQEEGIRAQGEATAKGFEEGARAEGLRMGVLKARETEQQAQLQESLKKEEEFRTRLATATEDQKNASTALDKFEFRDFWADKTTGSRISSTIGLILGGIGGANTGNNVALDILNKAIDVDLQKQKLNFGKLEKGVENKRTAYLDLRTQIQDERVADNLFKQKALEKYDAQLQQITAQSNSAIAKTNAEGARATVQKQIGDLQAANAKLTQDTVQSTTVSESVATTGKALPAAFKDAGDLMKAAQENTFFKDYNSKRKATIEFNNLLKQGAIGQSAAIGKFIASEGGLGQGSFTAELKDQLLGLGTLDSIQQQIKSKTVGGPLKKVLDQIGGAVEKDMAAYETEAQDTFKFYATEAKRLGVPPTAVLGLSAGAVGVRPSSFQATSTKGK